VDEDLAERVRAVLAGNGQLREVRMFGGLCFMLNGNMIGGVSKRGLLVRVGKEGHASALARPDARLMEMAGRLMEGYVVLYPHRRTSPPRSALSSICWSNASRASNAGSILPAIDKVKNHGFRPRTCRRCAAS
jgi:hypothetical protein